MDYTAKFFPETAPAHIAFALAAAGHDPGRASHPRRVFELGFGQGFGLALLAAANPDIAFEGCDANPRHVAHALGLIEDAGLANVTVEARLFEDIAAGGGARDVDVAIVHGVYAWIGAAARRALLAILAARMVEGGIVLVSYNCLPGWAPLDPLREMAALVARSEPDTSRRVDAFLALLSRMTAANAAYIAVTPAVGRHLASMTEADRAYLAHEYFGGPARALGFAEVNDAFAAAGFAYLASASIGENIEPYAVPAGMRALIDQAADAVARETLRDFGANKSFRRDLYRYGAAPDGSAALEALSGLRFALLVPLGETSCVFQGPLGEIRGHGHVFHPIFERLAAGAASFAELAALPGFAAGDHVAVTEALSLLVHARQIAPCPPTPPDIGPAHRFNRVVVERAERGLLYGHLASPVTRSGIALDELEAYVLAARRAGNDTADMVARRVRDMWRPAHAEGERDVPSMDVIAASIASFDGHARDVLVALRAIPATS